MATSAVTWHAQIRCIQYVASGSVLDGQTRHTTNKPLHLIQYFQFLKKYSVHIFSRLRLNTGKPLLGSVNKVLPLPLPLLYHLHRVEDDATNRVTFDYCEIVHKNISSSNCVKKNSTGQVICLKLERGGGRVG